MPAARLHNSALKLRQEWFERMQQNFLALWWAPAGHKPSVDEAKKRLAHLDAHGPSQYAFTFKTIHEPDESFIRAIDWSRFIPCPA